MSLGSRLTIGQNSMYLLISVPTLIGQKLWRKPTTTKHSLSYLKLHNEVFTRKTTFKNIFLDIIRPSFYRPEKKFIGCLCICRMMSLSIIFFL